MSVVFSYQKITLLGLTDKYTTNYLFYKMCNTKCVIMSVSKPMLYAHKALLHVAKALLYKRNSMLHDYNA